MYLLESEKKEINRKSHNYFNRIKKIVILLISIK